MNEKEGRRMWKGIYRKFNKKLKKKTKKKSVLFSVLYCSVIVLLVVGLLFLSWDSRQKSAERAMYKQSLIKTESTENNLDN
jgi:cytoskeletal protein RodZ